MENASKALIIAGGILISMIVISLFFYMFGNMSTLIDTTSEDTTKAEIVDFNKGFEAYNKKIMYGADLISVFNKATDNNRIYKATADNENKEYFINVIINFKNDLGTRTETYKKNARGNGYDKTNNTESVVFRKGNSYSLLNDKDKIQSLLIDAINWVDQDENKTYVNQDSSVSTYKPGCTTYTVTYYPAAEFKRKIFYCSDVKYSKTSGRVIEMTFTEKRIITYGGKTMENASKALIMAGGILIAMMILSLFVYEMANMSTTAKAYDETMARTEILSFNSRFEPYAYDSEGNDEKLKAQEIVTLYNYVQEWNYGGELNEGHPSDIVEINFGSAWDLKLTFNNIEKKNDTIENFLAKYPEDIYYFTCTDLKYREPDGRIYSLTIKCHKK